jgi:hypothetical protein
MYKAYLYALPPSARFNAKRLTALSKIQRKVGLRKLLKAGAFKPIAALLLKCDNICKLLKVEPHERPRLWRKSLSNEL